MALPDLWQRRSNESSRAYAAFVAYVNMGPDRSLRKMRAEWGQTAGRKPIALSSLERWSSAHDWVGRVAAIEQAEAEKVRKVDLERLRLLAIRQQRVATGVIDTADAAKKITVAQAIKLLDQGVRHQLLANGSPTERTQTELSGPGGGPIQTEEAAADDTLKFLEAKLDAIAAARKQSGD
jgi:hypothetical protein